MDNSVLHRNHGPAPTPLDSGKNNEKRTGWHIQNNYAAMHHDGDVVNTRMREDILARADREGLVAADVDNLSSSDFDSFCDAAWEVFGEEAPIVKIYSVEGNDPYEVEIIGAKGAYMVRASEFDDNGLFGTLKEAEACVEFNWLAQAEEDGT